jgi:hypothetical protein
LKPYGREFKRHEIFLPKIISKKYENEVVEAIYFGRNQQKKLRRSAHPTLPGCNESRRNIFLSRAKKQVFFQ